MVLAQEDINPLIGPYFGLKGARFCLRRLFGLTCPFDDLKRP